MVALTFDDGYQDFIEHAMPELERLGIPATLFVATGVIGQSYWWDEIACYLDPDKQTSTKLELRWDDPVGTRVYSGLTDKNSAASVAQDLCRDLSMSSATERADILRQIRHLSETRGDTRTPAKIISASELRELAASPNIEIGSHTVTHPRLAQLTPAEQQEEIETSRRHLESIAGPQNALGFSYPNGSFSKQTSRLVAELGLKYACTSQQDLVRKGQDLYRLPRLWAPDADTRKFCKWLASWRGLPS
jgi:peptidoglycan/xylan/chitin deacetylase (PgdA/CDA1 family)